MSPRGRPIMPQKRRVGHSPPPQKCCPTCLRIMTLTDARTGRERYECPVHGEPKENA